MDLRVHGRIAERYQPPHPILLLLALLRPVDQLDNRRCYLQPVALQPELVAVPCMVPSITAATAPPKPVARAGPGGWNAERAHRRNFALSHTHAETQMAL